jgi:(p)ppGpp synthase/HD superfamily hydrolase
MKSIVDIAREFAVKNHTETHHLYDGKPYTVHLEIVVTFIRKYSHLIPENKREIVEASGWGHDTVEDTRVSYNKVKKVLGEEIANIIFAVTNEKGKTRHDRANAKYYRGIRKTPFARFVKICDRLGNLKYSKDTQSRMFSRYVEELEDFTVELYTLNSPYQPMWVELYELTEQPLPHYNWFSLTWKRMKMFWKNLRYQIKPQDFIITFNDL